MKVQDGGVTISYLHYEVQALHLKTSELKMCSDNQSYAFLCIA